MRAEPKQAMERLTGDPPLLTRLARLARGDPPRVLDLFSGAGGISLGFQLAGFRIGGAVELDPLAALTHATNFHGGLDQPSFTEHAKARDITRVEPDEVAAGLRLGDVDTAIDVLVGGPPCQAYARVGRAKLREVANHPAAYRVDPRGNLYLRYLAYVRAFRPLALLIENVPDILHYSRTNVAEEIVEALFDLGYVGRYSLINAAFHGVPQMRDRVFLVAYRRELKRSVRFPKGTHYMELPPGYAGTRAVALRYVDRLGMKGWHEPDLGEPGKLPFPITAEKAIADLSPISGRSVRRGVRRFDKLSPYNPDVEPSDYAKRMREWPGFASVEGVYDHVIRYLPRDHRTFAEMRPGAEYPEAHATAARIARREAEARGYLKGTPAFDQLWREIVPPYDVAKFPNRWWKLRPDFPVHGQPLALGEGSRFQAPSESTQIIRRAIRVGIGACGSHSELKLFRRHPVAIIENTDLRVPMSNRDMKARYCVIVP